MSHDSRPFSHRNLRNRLDGRAGNEAANTIEESKFEDGFINKSTNFQKDPIRQNKVSLVQS